MEVKKLLVLLGTISQMFLLISTMFDVTTLRGIKEKNEKREKKEKNED